MAKTAGLRAWVEPRARGLGRLSAWMVPIGFVLQLTSFAQQVAYLIEPRPGELPLVLTVFVAVTVLSLAGIAAGALASASPDGRRAGALGAALAGAMLILFLMACAYIWNLLAAL